MSHSTFVPDATAAVHIMAFVAGTQGSVLSSTGPIIFIGHTIGHIPHLVQSTWSTKRVVISAYPFRIILPGFLLNSLLHVSLGGVRFDTCRYSPLLLRRKPGSCTDFSEGRSLPGVVFKVCFKF